MRVEPQFNQLNYPALICFLTQPRLVLTLIFYELLKRLRFAFSGELAAYSLTVSAVRENLSLPFPSG